MHYAKKTLSLQHHKNFEDPFCIHLKFTQTVTGTENSELRFSFELEGSNKWTPKKVGIQACEGESPR